MYNINRRPLTLEEGMEISSRVKEPVPMNPSSMVGELRWREAKIELKPQAAVDFTQPYIVGLIKETSPPKKETFWDRLVGRVPSPANPKPLIFDVQEDPVQYYSIKIDKPC